ncbi:hypothetical protein ACFLU5_16885 [Bacteroidota bacterium]
MKKYIFILALMTSYQVALAQGIFTLQYNTGFGVGDQNDYVESPSFRGMTFIDARFYVADYVTVGGAISWNIFYEDEFGTFNKDNTTINGAQYRYINSFPLLITVYKYWGDNDEITYYAGGGIGAYSIEQKTTMGLWEVVDDNWHFGLAPEVGVIFPLSNHAGFVINAKYNNAFKSGDSINFGYFGINVGFAWF